MAEKGYQEYAWILLAIIGVLFIIDGFMFLAGVNPDPPMFQNLLGQSLSSYSSQHPEAGTTITALLQSWGATMLGLGVFAIAVSYIPYRRGERWAWYIMWYLPIFMLLGAASNYKWSGESWPVDFVLGLVSLAALLLPYRKFFPKK
jgi:cell division protein FtsW (lipid II flippase)